MAKLKKVLGGLLEKYDLEEINILDTDKVIFSGTVDQWKITDIDMAIYKKAVENSDVTKRLMFQNRKAFIFIDFADPNERDT